MSLSDILFISLFFALTFYLHNVRVERNSCTWAHSIKHTHTHRCARALIHSVGLLWMSDRPVAQVYTWQHTTLTRETSISPAGFEPAIPSSERPQTHTLDRVAPVSARCLPWFEICLVLQPTHNFLHHPFRHPIQIFIGLTVHLPDFPHTRYTEVSSARFAVKYRGQRYVQ